MKTKPPLTTGQRRVVNLLAFGPALVENYEIVVNTKSSYSLMASNPRTVIGITDETTVSSSFQTIALQKAVTSRETA